MEQLGNDEALEAVAADFHRDLAIRSLSVATSTGRSLSCPFLESDRVLRQIHWPPRLVFLVVLTLPPEAEEMGAPRKGKQ